jgi:hypothetical protein
MSTTAVLWVLRSSAIPHSSSGSITRLKVESTHDIGSYDFEVVKYRVHRLSVQRSWEPFGYSQVKHSWHPLL